MAKKKQSAAVQLSLFDNFSDEPDGISQQDNSGGETAEQSKVRKNTKEQYFADMMERARMQMEEAEKTDSVVKINYIKNVANADSADKDSDAYRQRSKRQRLKVVFADGTIFCDASNTSTMIQTFLKIGVGRVADLGLETCHVPLVGREIVAKYEEWTKKISDGWFLMAQGDTRQKFMQIKSVITRLGIEATVELGDFSPLSSAREQGKNAKKQKAKLVVTMPDGLVVADTDHQHVLSKVTELIGVERIKKTGLMVSGKPVVTAVRKYNGQVQLINGEWLTVPATVKDKYKMLRVLASMTHVAFDVRIEDLAK